jgi:hypothetical protein
LERKLRNLIDRFLPRIVRNIFGQWLTEIVFGFFFFSNKIFGNKKKIVF